MPSSTESATFRIRIGSFLTRLLKRQPSQPPLPEGQVQYPLGLNREQVEALQHLASTPQWRSFSAALEAVCEQQFAQMIRGLPHEQYLVLCGKTQTLLDVLALPETIQQKASELHERTRTADAAPNASRFFGTGWFRDLNIKPATAPGMASARERSSVGQG